MSSHEGSTGPHGYGIFVSSFLKAIRDRLYLSSRERTSKIDGKDLRFWRRISPILPRPLLPFVSLPFLICPYLPVLYMSALSSHSPLLLRRLLQFPIPFGPSEDRYRH